MTILVTGASGQLGRSVVEEARERGATVTGVDHRALAIEDEAAVRAVLNEARPRLVVNCAAWTDVDGCESDPIRAGVVNGSAVGTLAVACRDVEAALVHVSTDYVFDGTAAAPYREHERPDPRSAYGRSKLLGEQALLAVGLPRAWIVRTSWVFGPGGRNFPRAILAKARDGGPLRVVDDQHGSPTFTRDLAPALLDLAALGAPSGIWHAANDGQCTWHEFAVEIVRRAGLDVPVERMSSADLHRPAPRPTWSVLDCSKLAGLRGKRLPRWTDALDRYLAEERT